MGYNIKQTQEIAVYMELYEEIQGLSNFIYQNMNFGPRGQEQAKQAAFSLGQSLKQFERMVPVEIRSRLRVAFSGKSIQDLESLADSFKK